MGTVHIWCLINTRPWLLSEKSILCRRALCVRNDSDTGRSKQACWFNKGQVNSWQAEAFICWTRRNSVKENQFDVGVMFRTAFVGKGTMHFQALWMWFCVRLVLRAVRVTLTCYFPSSHVCVGQPQRPPTLYQLKCGILKRNRVASSYSTDSEEIFYATLGKRDDTANIKYRKRYQSLRVRSESTNWQWRHRKPHVLRPNNEGTLFQKKKHFKNVSMRLPK